MDRAVRVRVSGPLAGYAPGLIDFLADEGYADQSMAEHVRRLGWLSGWLEAEGLDPAAVDEVLVGQVVGALRRAGRGRKCTLGSFRVVLGFLRQRGVVPAPPAAVPTPVDELLGDYRRYLVAERSLAPFDTVSTVATYLVRQAIASAADRGAISPGERDRLAAVADGQGAP